MSSENSLSPIIQQLLAALPEMFPGTQNIPLKNIRPNPDNPGAPITEDQIRELAENMQARGLLNAIRVNPDSASPLVDLPPISIGGGAQPHPDNFRLKADGQPWELADFNFIVLTGENRYRAALWLKWETIAGHILNPTAEEAVIINHLDNDIRERGWWASYQSIEQLIKANPRLTQREVGTRLKMSKDKVNRALSLLPLLNAEARALIVSNEDNQNKGIWGISERATVRLADLGPGTGLKRGVRKKEPPADTPGASQTLYPYPPIPAETQELVYQTLVTACDQQMTEAQMAKLVEKAKTVRSSSPRSGISTPPGSQEFQASKETSNSSLLTTNSTSSSPYAKAPGDRSASPHTPSGSSSPSGSQPSLLLELLAGVSIIGQIKSKIKKKEKVSWGEMLLVIGHDTGKGLGWVIKHVYKLLKEVFKIVWKVLKHGTKALTKLFGPWVYRFFNAAMPIILLIGFGYLAWDVYQHGAASHPVRFLEAQAEQGLSRWKDSIFHPSANNTLGQPSLVARPDVSQQVPSTQVTGSASTPVAAATSVPAPAVISHPVGASASSAPDSSPKGIANKQEISAAPIPRAVVAIPTSAATPAGTIAASVVVQATPTVQKPDVVGQAAGSVAGDAAVDAVRHLLPF